MTLDWICVYILLSHKQPSVVIFEAGILKKQSMSHLKPEYPQQTAVCSWHEMVTLWKKRSM